MFEKNYGTVNVANTVMAFILYTLIGSIILFVINYVSAYYVETFISFLGIVTLVINTVVIGKLALLLVNIMKLENVMLFRKLSILSGVAFFASYTVSKTFGFVSFYLLNDSYNIFENLSNNIKTIINDFSYYYVEYLEMPIIFSRRGRVLEISGIFLYIILGIVFIILVWPRGSFNFKKYVYINGEKVIFDKVYALIENKDIRTSQQIMDTSFEELTIIDDPYYRPQDRVVVIYYTKNYTSDYRYHIMPLKVDYDKKNKPDIPYTETYYYTTSNSIEDLLHTCKREKLYNNEEVNC